MVSQYFAQQPNHQGLSDAVNRLNHQYPQAMLSVIGHSSMGRDIYSITLGTPRNSALLLGGVDGQDASVTLLLLRFAERLLSAVEEGRPLCDIDVSRVLSRRGIRIIPCLNPDGLTIALEGAAALPRKPLIKDPTSYSIPWQANAQGVQLSRNFDAGWNEYFLQAAKTGCIEPAPAGFGGISPFSQPETLCLVRFCAAVPPRRLYHFSHGKNAAIQYGYGGNVPESSRLIAGILSSSCGYPASPSLVGQNHATPLAWGVQGLGCPSFQICLCENSGVSPYPKLEETLLLAMMV